MIYLYACSGIQLSGRPGFKPEVPGSNPGVPLYNFWKTREKWHRSREYTWLGYRFIVTLLKQPAGVWALLQCFLFRVKCILSRSMSFFSSLSKIIQGEPGCQTSIPFERLSRMLYHWATPARHTKNIVTVLKQQVHVLQWCWIDCMLQCFFSSDSRSMSVSLVFQKLYKGTPGFEPGTSRTADPCSTTELYPAACIFNNITANTCRLFEHLLQNFLFRVKQLSRSMSVFLSLSKIIQGDTRVQTRDPRNCPLYNFWKTEKYDIRYTWLGTKNISAQTTCTCLQWCYWICMQRGIAQW